MFKSWYLKYVLSMSGLFFVTIGYNACSNDADFQLRDGASSLEEFQEVNDPNYVAPKPKVIINGGAAYTKDVAVNLTLDPDQRADSMKISDSPDCSDGSWEAYSANKTWQLKSKNDKVGVYVRYRYQDLPETKCVFDEIFHDDIAPVVGFQNPLTTQWVADKNIKIQYTAIDAGSGIKVTECDKAGNGQFATCGTDVYFNSMVENQNYMVIVRATDNAGNLSSPIQLNWKSDQTPPTVVFNSTPGAATSDSTPSFGFEGTDLGSGIKSYECKLDGGNFVACNKNHTVNPALMDGPHNFSVRAYDNVGRVSEVITHQWNQDSMAPTIQFTQTPKSIENQGNATFAFAPINNLQGVVSYVCKLDGGAFATCSSPWPLSSLGDGSHTFSVKGTDGINTSEAISYTWKIDTMKPIATITGRPSAIDKRPDSVFSFDARDGGNNGTGIKEIQCRLDSAAFQVCGPAKTFTIPQEGSHTVEVRAVDNAGNVSPIDSYTWLIDRTGPVVTIGAKPLNPTKSLSSDFSFTANPGTGSAIDYIECKLNGGAYSVCVSPKNYSNAKEGTNIFSVRAYDVAGNESNTATYEWLLDTKGPELDFTLKPEPIVYLGTAAQIRFIAVDENGSGVKNYECKKNGTIFNCTGETTYSYNSSTAADHSVEVTAFDNVGNSTTKTVTWSTRYQIVDKEAPLVVGNDRPVDILFIIDTSGSMDDERRNLAQKFNGFLNMIKDLDFQIAVTTTDVVGTQSYEDGRLTTFKNASGPYILDSSYDLSEAQQLFGTRVQNLPKGDGNEQGIYATVRMIQRALDGKNPVNREFIRNNADLAVVVLSDEDENSNGANVKYTPTKFLEFVNTAFGKKKNFTFHSIITKPGDTSCKNNGGASYGVNYAEVSKLTGYGQPGGAIIGSVCAVDYTSQLTAIGQSVKDMQKSMSLECSPLDLDNDGKSDMEVSFRAVGGSNYSAYPGAFTIQGQKIVFEDYLEPGDYKFNFKCNK